MRKTFEKYSLKLGILAILLVSVFSWQSCKKDEAPVYPPNLENKEVVSPTEIQFTFSKEMDKTTGENVSTYKFEPSIEISKAVVNGKVITLTLAKPLNGGQYRITFENLQSSDGGVFPYKGEFFTPTTLDYTSVWKKQTNLHVPFANGGDPNTWTFFSLKDNKVVNLDLASVTQSKDWDIVFALDGQYMMIMSNSEYSNSPKLSGKGAIGVEEKSIEELTEVGEQRIFDAASGTIISETRAYEAEGFRFGYPWCEKDVDNIFGYEVQNNPLIPFRLPKNRTIVFKTAEGKYGKLQMQSIYKETPPNPLPADYDQYYLTFRYVIQENGKNELDIPIDVE